ncbi:MULTISPECIES: FAD-binding oxidoreductase [Brucella]|uniref:FAD linked oxidase domain protein n=1 Tax=Brucella anthropi (strain ATCC 49188 / DSM 6882 / CCUG 24695 / JCM 21032 / LMG 3331 / NBRC 15819 / NCTC 12168 / Alc 37) TaxID=439375 RepID=A6X1S1_BRUA4|nr:FAD-binding oxidoreductase [Brucella anthropi]ABS15175.1 FAD linked oxidase domain protein [Brucella anthropi ATCC 49188]KAB2746962.1 FAD-binding oxidoreductase [Brucella anthropi]KAB2762159.1 FAD-binding oxidoreductase [Brucella anthropi]KAB2782978.1 FAD-binding oxidoreductase [Brucella anthropi]MDH0366898.1 FAD-binding oxidoreductase [Brucella anthropi]
MISKEAIKRGYNRGNYVVGAPTQPHYAGSINEIGTKADLAQDAVSVDAALVAKLQGVADEVLTAREDLVVNTRDWWARTMVAETGGKPATVDGVFVRVSTVEQVQAVMRLAHEAKVPVTVSAGRSNVTGAALPLRGGIVLDVCNLNRFVSFDADSQIVEVEAGMFGDIFEEMIQRDFGMTMGHWPSSFGISTVGGWIACRGAGQLSTRYGKIEDMVYGMEVVLADGSLVTVGNYARAAIGPDLQQIFIGSEGTLGIIVKARLKLHRLPDYARAIAYGFKSFAIGLEACRRIMQGGANPAALRLYDELESGVQFGLPESNVLLIADEGAKEMVDAVMAISEKVCAELGDKLDGDTIFEKWLDTRYLTGKSAEGFKRSPGFVADTLEMTGCWRDLPAIYDEVVAAINAVPGTLAGSAHQSHAYVDGACLYFSLRGDVEVEKRAEWYRAAWDAANAVLIKYGAALSHHHGVGLLRAPYMKDALGSAFPLLETVKKALDPDNLLNPGKLGLSLDMPRDGK